MNNEMSNNQSTDDKIKNMPRYHKCMYHWRDFQGHHYCRKKIDKKQEIQDFSQCEKCDRYKCRYIEYPLTVNKISVKNPEAFGISFTPVRVRLCENNKTYFGILLGDFPYQTMVSYAEEEKELKVSIINNPCILIPELSKVVFGAETWWSEIEPGEDITDITQEDINKVWYIKFLKALCGHEK